MFTRFYLGLFVSALVVIGINYSIFKLSYEVRHLNYAESSLQPVMDLILEQGLSAPKENRQAYLRIASDLLGAQFDLVTQRVNDTVTMNGNSFNQMIANSTDEVLWHVVFDASNERKEVYEYRFSEIDEQIFRGHALLMAAASQNSRLIDHLRPFGGIRPDSPPYLVRRQNG